MKQSIVIILSALNLVFCGRSKEGLTKEEVKALDFVRYKITVPATWKQFTMNGIDSSIIGIVTDKNNTIYLSYGTDYEGFNETVKVYPFETKAHLDSINWPYVDEMIFSENSGLEEAQGIHLNEYYMFDTINSRRAKIMLPKIPGSGGVGIHFSEINPEGEKLSIYAENIDSSTQWQLYNAFKTIKFN